VARFVDVSPPAAIPGGRVTLSGSGFEVSPAAQPRVTIGGIEARVSAARATRLTVTVPRGIAGGVSGVTVEGVDGEAGIQVGGLVADGLHQVDSPVFDAEGRLYLTYSGTRGQQVPVSIFRIDRSGAREQFVTGLLNPTGMAFGPDGHLYVSSRFEGVVYKVDESGHYEPFVSDVGVACGLAFTRDGALVIGDRSGSILRVLPDRKAVPIATLPASIAAFHLAIGPDDAVYVTGPTLSARDYLYRVSPDGAVDTVWKGFGRPQGLAAGPDRALYVVEALAGASGLFRLHPGSGAAPELVLSGVGLVGVAFDPGGGLVVVTNDAAWRLDGLTVTPAR
jgi:sugar lactone lactonase YvrE